MNEYITAPLAALQRVPRESFDFNSALGCLERSWKSPRSVQVPEEEFEPRARCAEHYVDRWSTERGSSPTTEPKNNSADAAPSASSSMTRGTAASLSRSGVHRTIKSTYQGRKRGGDHYTWLPSSDHPSSPTTDETLPTTPQSDMSSTFSVSSSPQPSFQQPRSPIYERRNAVSAGPHHTDFGFLSCTVPASSVPTSSPLIPTPTWPMSTAEEVQRFPEPIAGELVHTRSDSALGTYGQTLNQHTNVGSIPEIPQIAFPLGSNQQSGLTNYAASVYQHSHCVYRPPNTHIGSSLLAGQTPPWQNFQSIYPSGSMAAHFQVAPNDNFSLESPSTSTVLPDTYANYNPLCSSVDETNNGHFFGLSGTYAPPPMTDAVTSHLRGISPSTRGASAQSPQEQLSLAHLTFNHNHSIE
ncbi:hypothetical protein OPQ81_008825 [Rhizoctonia solani]|nr:hypothetical protein OPQ81_008825 [Rhizoctonia solani]